MNLGEAIKGAFRRCWRLLGPDTTPEERKELATSPTWNAQERARIEALARAQQARIIEKVTALGKYHSQTEHKAVDGLGEKIGSIPYEAYMQMRVEHGDDCWDDPHFIKAFFRDNPACRAVTTRGTRGQEYGGTR
jgi:hypothetical protein